MAIHFYTYNRVIVSLDDYGQFSADQKYAMERIATAPCSIGFAALCDENGQYVEEDPTHAIFESGAITFEYYCMIHAFMLDPSAFPNVMQEYDDLYAMYESDIQIIEDEFRAMIGDPES